MSHLFDNLKYKGLWETKAHFDLFGSEATLAVSGPGKDKPLTWQRELYDEFVAKQGELKPAINKAILKYYKGVVKEYRSKHGSNADRLAPVVNEASEIRKLVTPDAVYIPLEPKGLICLLMGCTWDYENGLGVKIMNWKVQEVGFQEICL